MKIWNNKNPSKPIFTKELFSSNGESIGFVAKLFETKRDPSNDGNGYRGYILEKVSKVSPVCSSRRSARKLLRHLEAL